MFSPRYRQLIFNYHSCAGEEEIFYESRTSDVKKIYNKTFQKILLIIAVDNQNISMIFLDKFSFRNNTLIILHFHQNIKYIQYFNFTIF